MIQPQSPNGEKVNGMHNSLSVTIASVSRSRWKCLEVPGWSPECAEPLHQIRIKFRQNLLLLLIFLLRVFVYPRNFKFHRSNIYVIFFEFVFRAFFRKKIMTTKRDVTRKHRKKYQELRRLKNPPTPPTGPTGQTSGAYHRDQGTKTVHTDKEWTMPFTLIPFGGCAALICKFHRFINNSFSSIVIVFTRFFDDALILILFIVNCSW